MANIIHKNAIKFLKLAYELKKEGKEKKIVGTKKNR